MQHSKICFSIPDSDFVELVKTYYKIGFLFLAFFPAHALFENGMERSLSQTKI